MRLTLRSAFDRYHRSASHSARTIEDYYKAIDHWERLTGDPDLHEVDNLALWNFSQALMTSIPPGRNKPLSKTSVAKYLREVQAIFSTIGPVRHGKPDAFGILDRVPVCRKPPIDETPVITIEADEVDRIYEACRIATWPKKVSADGKWIQFVPVDWWRCLLVYLYNVGSRRNEFLGLRRDQIDFDRRMMTIDPEKHGDSNWKPLHANVIDHMRTIWLPNRTLLFACPRTRTLYKQWHRIQEAAGIHVPRPIDSDRKPYYSFHEVRKTAGTNWAEHSPSAAQHMLGHRSLNTTVRHYINRGKLAQRIEEKISQPSSFARRENDNPNILRFPAG